MSDPVLDFWLEFGSTYSCPAAMRIGALAAQAGVTVALAALRARCHFQGAGMAGGFALQLASSQRQIHVARSGAHLRRSRTAVPPSRSVPSAKPAGRARCDAGPC